MFALRSLPILLILFQTPGTIQSTPSLSGRKVTLTLDKVSGEVALRKVLRAGGVNYVVTDDVLRAATKVEFTKTFSDVPFREALNTILREVPAGDGRYRYRVEDSVYHIFAVDVAKSLLAGHVLKRETALDSKRKVSLALDNVPIREALQQLFDRADNGYVLPEMNTRAKVSLSVTSVPFEGGLTSILKAPDPQTPSFAHTDVAGVVVIHRTRTGSGEVGTPQSLSMRIDEGNIRYALKALFTCFGANYTIDQAVEGMISIGVTNVSLRTALESILQANSANRRLTYRVEDGVFIIAPMID